MDAETKLEEDLKNQEFLIASGLSDEALNNLLSLVHDAEDFIETNYETTDKVQYFNFEDNFELIAYKRVEKDPRKIVVVSEPFSDLYEDLGLCYLLNDDFKGATAAFKQAIRWNPMNMVPRLDLAETCRMQGNEQEWINLSFSVLSRASNPEHLIQAYANFAEFFKSHGDVKSQAAALFIAKSFGIHNEVLDSMVDDAIASGADPTKLTSEEATKILEEQGLPAGANADIAVCLLMCSMDEAAEGDNKCATTYMLKARDLVGSAACEALYELLQES